MKRQQSRADYQVVPYPKYRRWMAAAFRATRHKPVIHGLFEVDVTVPRTALRAHKAKTGESLSYTAFLSACLAKAVDEHKAVQAYRQGSGRLVVFDDVDVLTDMEREVAGRKYVVPHVIRAANRKTVRELHDEIRAAQRADGKALLKGFKPLALPDVLFRPFVWAWGVVGRRRPQVWKTIVGTVELSSVGMFGTGAGWGISPPSATSLMVVVGGIGQRPAVMDGRTVSREYLSMTISMNHEIVDGAPTARFAQRLNELIESGYGLEGLSDTPAAHTSEQGAVDAAARHVVTATRMEVGQ
jgi:pyruvate/2-oxoglutarate dehydrogenase complex dihydrolipoamide acyltransferase (E2) component